ncbi:flagellar hook-basal body complex protein FliE [Cohnella caldifontis]|uniref:flagellar hook-basal body complex protein FliE n=1 Tax=Cohnella caldifontis TaxID=3027471 RepID=UPI0023EC7BF9|nr:flagellar hook-basal body complex protein FliE [Cohnella sp. YIM B05605]
MIQSTTLFPLNAQAAINNVSSAGSKATPAQVTASFADFLKDAIDSVAAQESAAHTVTEQFMIGQADVNDVMIASSKAELSLSLTSQVRNKVIEAYQEIMRTQI